MARSAGQQIKFFRQNHVFLIKIMFFSSKSRFFRQNRVFFVKISFFFSKNRVFFVKITFFSPNSPETTFSTVFWWFGTHPRNPRHPRHPRIVSQNYGPGPPFHTRRWSGWREFYTNSLKLYCVRYNISAAWAVDRELYIYILAILYILYTIYYIL